MASPAAPPISAQFSGASSPPGFYSAPSISPRISQQHPQPLAPITRTQTLGLPGGQLGTGLAAQYQDQEPDLESSSTTAKHQCSHCGSSFKRPEHLKRHQRSHEESKRFSCRFCDKRFARSDILARHLAIHTHPSRLAEPGTLGAGDLGDADGPGEKRKRRRACFECARAREKCTRGQPCLRCSCRRVDCVYPAAARKVRQKTAAAASNEAAEVDGQTDEDEGDAEAEVDVVDEDEMMLPLAPADEAGTIVTGSHGFDSQGLRDNGSYSTMSMGYPLPSQLVQEPNSVLTPTQARQEIPIPSHVANSTILGATGPSILPPTAQPPPMDYYTDTSLLDFPINWLPANDAMDLDYDSIPGFGFGASSTLFGDLSQLDNQATMYENAVPTSPAFATAPATAVSPAFTPDPGLGLISYPMVGNEQAVASPANTVSAGSHSSSLDAVPPSAAPGGLYATSTNGARVPCTVRSKRPKRPSVVIYHATPIQPISEAAATGNIGIRNSSGSNTRSSRTITEPPPRFTFPDLQNIFPGNVNTDLDQARIPLLTPTIYETLRRQFGRLCLAYDGMFPAFLSPRFPPLDHLNLFVRLFFEHFNPVLPIIHETVTDVNLNEHWYLGLAMATVGCQYTQTQEFSACVAPMHEFLRRALVLEAEGLVGEEATGDDSRVVTYIQATVLCHVSMLYYGSTWHSSLAMRRRSSLAELVRSHRLLEVTPVVEMAAAASNLERRWKMWVRDETRRRLGYAIWLLDAMSVYHFGVQPHLSLDIAEADLPHDGLWEAASRQEWTALFQRHERNPSLSEAVQTIFVEKHVKPDLGELGRILVLHGVYNEILHVKSYCSRPLSSWMPSAQQPQPGSNRLTPRSIAAGATRPATTASPRISQSKARQWLPENASFASWRNAGLDCVDVLHWAANGTIALLSGAEHPTVLHLHMSRVVLLAPCESIRTLALSISSLARPQVAGLPVPAKEDGLEAEREVLQWAQRDEHKARLCVLHCGCFLWHIRRYSAMGFYEPVSVFLAILTLWAYSSYTSRPTPSSSTQTQHPQNSQHQQEAEPRSGSVSRRETPDPVPNPGPNPNQATHRPEQVSNPSPHNLSATPSSANSHHHAHHHPQQQQQVMINPSPGSDLTTDTDPTFIRLDRPCDDELVQFFVRSGRPSAVRAYVTGVGDICAPRGPARILREGRKILDAISLAWGRTGEYVRILEAMERAVVGVGEGR